MARHEQLTVNELTLLGSCNFRNGPGVNPTGGQDYFVDGNKVANGPDGKTIKKAYNTLATAIAASDASISSTVNRWFARRNRIFVMGDTLTENLVKFPTKCDVIGIGSYNGNTQPGLYGQHAPVGETYACRWANIHFRSPATAAPIVTLTSAASGVEFHDKCCFDGILGTMTSAILSTASLRLVVDDCDFIGTFATSYVSIGAGTMGWMRIGNNRMLGTAAKGTIVDTAATAGATRGDPLIDNNIIHATGLVIDDDSGLCFGTDNKLFTDADITEDASGAMNVTKALWANNKLNSSAGEEHNCDFPFIAQTTS